MNPDTRQHQRRSLIGRARATRKPTSNAAVGSVLRLCVVLIGVAAAAALAPAASGSAFRAGHDPLPWVHLGARNQSSWAGLHWGFSGGTGTLDGSPGADFENPKTATLYVPIQCTDSSCSTPMHVVDVINAAKCSPGGTSNCPVVARATVGTGPLAGVIDEHTDTLYVVGGGTVTVLNGGLCNASVTTGCSKPIATITVGGSSVAAAYDPATGTVYVASLAGAVFVINAAACNAVTTTGCAAPVKTLTDSLGPDWVDVDVATDTVYAANAGPNGDGSGNTVSVFNGATCNATVASGCGQSAQTVTVGSNPLGDAVDQATDTVYVANYNDGTVSVINGATCNAKVTSGCGQTPPAVPTGGQTAFVAVDDALHTAFALNQADDTISAIDTQTCSGTTTSGCAMRPPNETATFNPPQGVNQSAFALDPQTGAAYLVNVGGEAFVGSVSVTGCNATSTAACRVEAPSVPAPDRLLAVDSSTHTIYGGDLTEPQIDVFNAATCDASDLAGCAPVATIPMADPSASVGVGSIDDATHTLYAADPSSNFVAVINIAACNATNTTGCANPVATITVGPNPGAPVLDAATRTLYLPYGPSSNLVGVIDVASCNAIVTSGCGQTPATVNVGQYTGVIALSPATNTVYAPSAGNPLGSGDTVDVINGATCNATEHSGCGRVAATVKVGAGPIGVAVNDLTHSVYVANWADGDLPGTVSIINSSTCNGTHTGGCAASPPTVPVGRSPTDIEVDTTTDFVYVADASSAAVSIINGATCNAQVRSGCGTRAPQQPIGSEPGFGPSGLGNMAISPGTNTVYVPTLYGSGAISIFKGSS